MAGIIVAILAIPEGMAYAMIAGLPPQVGMSQAKNLLGVTVPHTEHFYELVIALSRRLPETNLITLSLGAVSLLVLLLFHHVLRKWLTRWKAPQGFTSFAT